MSRDTDKSERTYPGAIEAHVENALSPFQSFINDQKTGSVLLIVCTLCALILANSPLVHDYERLIETPFGFILGNMSYEMSLRHWVNDGLMALFFFVLGLEIKREILVGELKDPQQSLPVIIAALGGMLVPAAIFFMINQGTETVHGWGIPMATDTAFAVGILSLLGRRIPISLFAFLTALAIIDDLGAILVIAAFYTESINWAALGISALLLFCLLLCNLLGCRKPSIYFAGGILVWLAMYNSGVHATVAGILVAMTVPARPKREAGWFVHRTRKLLDRFEEIEDRSSIPILGEKEQHDVVAQVHTTAEKATTPLRRWEHALDNPVTLFIMPLFALVNAGIPINLDSISAVWTEPLGLGIVLGLLLGKCLGISLFLFVAIKLGLGKLTQGVTIHHIIGISLLAGMGFTMSIFISSLGVDDPGLLVIAKTAILLASLVAGITGYCWLRFISSKGDS